MKQTCNGKAFEYALLMAFSEIIQLVIKENSSLKVAKNCYEELESKHRNILKRASLEAALFLQAHDTKISSAHSVLLQKDSIGINEDARDIVIETQSNSIGISAKYNHTAIKHSRLSDTIDFGEKWSGYPCSEKYFKTISSVFDELRDMQEKGILFRDVKDKDIRIYLPVLNAFENELKRLCESFGDLFVKRLFLYLLGCHDFYKIMLKTRSRMNTVAIQSVNIEGTLGYGIKWKIPDKIHVINRKNKSSNTIEVIFNEGWSISFRLHNARSEVKSSLKFDIQFIGIPSNIGFHLINI